MKILLATDGSNYSEKALEALINFDSQKIEEIKIVSIVDMSLPLPIDMYGAFVPSTSEIEEAVIENAQKIVESTKQKLQVLLLNKNASITTDTPIGSPESRIVEIAEEMKADLIVLGSHGYKRWERLLLGSVSDSVTRHAHCSVMVVRTAE